MRILLLTQWFQPEPHFKGLPLAQALRLRGHEVEVVTGFPNYPGGTLYPGYRVRPWRRERIDGIRVTRAPLYPSHDRSAVGRILNYVSFAASSALAVLTVKRPDVVYVYCPPMTAAAGAVLLRLLRRVPYVVDIQDLWPDTLGATGMVRSGTILRLVGAWSKIAMRMAAGIVVLSPGFKRRLEERGLSVPIRVIPNWAPPEIVAQRDAGGAERAGDIDTFEILFAGNMGKAQALNTVIEAARTLVREAPQVRFTFIGGGIEADALKAAAAGLETVRVLPPRHPSEMGPVFAQADALLVHLRDDPLFQITIPSKTQAYLAVGKPVLMGVRGDAASMIADAGAGLSFAPEQPEALIEAVMRLVALAPEERRAMGRSGARYYDEMLAFDRGVDALAEALAQAAGRGPGQRAVDPGSSTPG